MKHYLGVFYLPRPQREHAQITPTLKAVAQDVKLITMGGNCVMYLFASDVLPHNISFARILHTGDQAFFMEIGDYTTTRDFNTVQGWLDSHRPRR